MFYNVFAVSDQNVKSYSPANVDENARCILVWRQFKEPINIFLVLRCIDNRLKQAKLSTFNLNNSIEWKVSCKSYNKLKTWSNCANILEFMFIVPK